MKYYLIKDILLENNFLVFVRHVVGGEIIHTADNYLECRQHIPIENAALATKPLDLTLCPEKLKKNPYHGGQLDKLIPFNDKPWYRTYFPSDDKDYQQLGATYTIAIEFTDPKTLMEELELEINNTNSEDGSRKYWARHYFCNMSLRYIIFADDPRTFKEMGKLWEWVMKKLQLNKYENDYLVSRLFDLEGKYPDNPEGRRGGRNLLG
jgi:hypothetical protein